MGDVSYVGRIGELAVALGVGAAIATGAGAGTAWADESGPDSAAGQSPAATDSQHPTPKAKRQDRPTRAATESAAADTASSGAAAAGFDAGTPAAGSARRDSTRRTARRHSTISERNDRPASSSPEADGGSVVKVPSKTASVRVVAVKAVDVEKTPATAAVAIREKAAPNVVATAITTVSSLVRALFTPSASHVPLPPAAEPQLWTMLAGARREHEGAPSVPDSPIDAQVTGRVNAASARIAATEAPTAQTVAVQNSLTYTAPPTLLDRFTLASLRVLRVVSNFLGVDIYGQIGKLMASSGPPFFVKFGLDVRQSEYEVAAGNVWKVWEFVPPEPTGKTVVAVHGGGFILQPILTHWIDYSNMARQTGATVVVPMYPLATTDGGTALKVVPAMADFISHVVDMHGADDVSIYADSAGTSLAMAAARELILRGASIPASMVLLSLNPDATLSNPDIKKSDDPIIDVKNLDFYRANGHWSDGIADLRDPILSPLFMESEVFRALPPITVYVGSTEFLLPDTLLLYERAMAEGAPISVVVGRGQIHDWPVGGLPINSQAPKVRRDIYRQLGLVA